jgi:hypothetical protein
VIEIHSPAASSVTSSLQFRKMTSGESLSSEVALAFGRLEVVLSLHSAQDSLGDELGLLLGGCEI